jgi:hypothetical protein
MKTSSGGCKVFFSWKVRNPSAALYDYTGESDETNKQGLDLFIPWNDNIINEGSRRKRSTDDATGTVYGAVVGAQQKTNNFALSYTDSATGIKAGGSFLHRLFAFTSRDAEQTVA